VACPNMTLEIPHSKPSNTLPCQFLQEKTFYLRPADEGKVGPVMVGSTEFISGIVIKLDLVSSVSYHLDSGHSSGLNLNMLLIHDSREGN
jgi:hypothetical protein